MTTTPLFDALVFKPHTIGHRHAQARVDFDNGYGASVVTGEMFYVDPEHPYEVAVMRDGHLYYSTPITDDVVGHQNKFDVEALLARIKALPKEKRV